MTGSTSGDRVGPSSAAGEVDELWHIRSGTADAPTAASFRRAFGEWIDRHLDLDEERVADIVLATDEAMSNCADHAYRVVDHVGIMTLQIGYHPVKTELQVNVIDRGRWSEPDLEVSNVRGRGILLMRALADNCAIDGGSQGTTVCLRFKGCPPKSFVLSQAC